MSEHIAHDPIVAQQRYAERIGPSAELPLRQVLKVLPVAAYTCDPEGLITSFNDRARILWGRAPALNDPANRFCGSFRIFTADGSPLQHDESWMALALRERKPYDGFEAIVERPSGERITVLAHATPIFDDAGELLGAVNVLIDISDRKKAENTLKAADRSKNEFLATLAHELRNPLAPIRNAVHVLQGQRTAPPDAQWALDMIDRQLRQMTRLVDDLLDVSRITRDKLELRRERVSLTQVLHAAAEISRPIIEAHAQELVLTFPNDATHVDADLTRLAQAISNVLNNAAKYTPRGGHIRFHSEVEGNTAVVTVRDDGVGIPADMLDRIFEMFTQVDGTLERTHDGLGIGLTLAKRLVEMHGGTIAAHSDGPGLGSEFVIRLPTLAGAAARPSLADEGSIGAPNSSLRILVVDDNRDVATSMARLLTMMGNEVLVAHDGFQALEAAHVFQPQLAILDLGLPRMNGFELAQRIRARQTSPLVIIALTGWGQTEYRERSEQAGFDHHLVKPFDPEKLMALIASLQQADCCGGAPRAD